MQNAKFLTLAGVMAALATSFLPAQELPLFNGKNLTGWEGDPKVWRVEDGAIVGGSLAGNPQNEFLAFKERVGDFILKFDYKLTGTEGFINGGVQFRSERIKDPAHEMRGYQADIGAGYSGALYDESRRNRMLAQPAPELVEKKKRRTIGIPAKFVRRASISNFSSMA
ncbi:MAG: DUF1080 domain-containing protein [Verrucomicrobia bacterium]|nr:DUF1080 domain-containing protein [Verrucomicrobiota bacterium]